MRVALDTAELSDDSRLHRIPQVEDEALPAGKAVREQLTVRRHLVFGVMRTVPASRDRDRRDQPPIPIGMFGDVEDREEVGFRGVGRRGPEIKVLGGGDWRGRGTLRTARDRH